MLVASLKFACNCDRSLSSVARSFVFSDWYDGAGVSQGDVGCERLLLLEEINSGRFRNDLVNFSECLSSLRDEFFVAEDSFFPDLESVFCEVELELASGVPPPWYFFVGLRRRINLETAFPEASLDFSGRRLLAPDVLRSAIS